MQCSALCDLVPSKTLLHFLFLFVLTAYNIHLYLNIRQVRSIRAVILILVPRLATTAHSNARTLNQQGYYTQPQRRPSHGYLYRLDHRS